MRAIDKFILHVVHNWKDELNEAIGAESMKNFIKNFQQQADDLNINITDDQLRAYINTFDKLKNGLPPDQRDLAKWDLGKFIRLVTKYKGEESAEEVDITPDVVYHNDDNTIVIYNGSKEDNCIRYGSGERWCITRSSFASYRYSERKDFPTFYLAKNNNLSDSNKLSFVAIQVRDPQRTIESERYVYTDRTNSPNESDPMSFEELMSEVPWLREVPNIKSILKYIPISSKEKLTQQYQTNPISYREWTKLPYSVKQQYLVVRKNSSKLFSDITNEEFVEKYLPKYPELAKFIAETPGIIDSLTLLQYLDKFPNQIRRSITANLRDKINTKQLSTELFPFDVKKLLVQLNKWNLDSNERLYVTKDGDTIVKLTIGDDIRIGLYQAEDDYPNVKLNKRTSKYLLDYPELDKIPLKNLLKLSEEGIIDRELITKVLNNAKNDPNSAIVIKPVEDGDIVLDSNSFVSYKVDKEGKISSLPFDNEEVQQVFNDAKDNEAFQQNALNLFKDSRNIPETVDKDALLSVVKAIPYNQRIYSIDNIPVVLLTTSEGNVPFFAMKVNPTSPENYLISINNYGKGRQSWRILGYSDSLNDEMMKSYLTYLRQTNKAFNDNEILSILKTQYYSSLEPKKAFVKNNPPVDQNNVYKLAMNGDTALVINSRDPRNSFKISDNSGKLVKANVPSALARQLLGPGQQAPGQVAAQANAATRARRGRPAGVPNAPRPQQPVAQGNLNLSTITNQYNLTQGFLNIPTSIGRKFRTPGRQVPVANDRGASRRNNILGNAGRVIAVYEFGPSSLYIIQLANNTQVASVVVQPGNSHWIVTNNNAYPLATPANLLLALQQRNLAEIHRYLTNEYFNRNPHHLTEFRQLLRNYINEKKNEN